jgi:integrase/recombinase XerC
MDTPPTTVVPAPWRLDLATPGGGSGVLDVISAWKAGKQPRTLACYAWDMEAFAAWCGTTPESAVIRLLASNAGQAHQVALNYMGYMQVRKLAAATCARRLATLRSLTRAARLVGAINWTLELPTPKVTAYRDTRGPGRAGFLRIIAAADEQREPKRSRDLAILWLLYGRALRRAEVVGLRFPEDVDLGGERVNVLGKNRTEREWLTIPPATCRALTAWIAMRGDQPGPLFFRLDRAAGVTGERHALTGLAVRHLVGALGKQVGLVVRPHGLRHAAITEVLDVTRGDFRTAQRFGRLAKADTLKHYDDNREDLGGQAARLIAP